jgi:hypothetical protein
VEVITLLALELDRTVAAIRTQWTKLRRDGKLEPRKRIPFTDAEDLRILEVCRDGIIYGRMYEELAREMNRTVQQVRHRRARLKERGDAASFYRKTTAVTTPLPVASSSWIKSPTRAQLMAGR